MAVVICATFAAGCQGKTPQRAADTYLGNLKLFNYPACYQALSHQDQVDRTIDQFLSEVPMAPDVSKDWFKGILRTYDYKVGDSKTQGDKEIVTVSVTRPDLELWERTADAAASGDTTPDQIAQKNLTDNTYPKVTYDDNMVMVNQGGEWHLLVNFPFRENIIKEHKDAVDLYHKHDYDKAIAADQKIIDELDKDQSTGNAGLKFQYGRELADIQNSQKQLPDAQAYVPKIVLSDVDLKMSSSRVPGIFGKMTNSGDKALDEVQFTVTYYEGKGKNKKGGPHRSSYPDRDCARVYEFRTSGAALRTGRDARLRFPSHCADRRADEVVARLDRHVDCFHAIRRAAAKARRAIAVARRITRRIARSKWGSRGAVSGSAGALIQDCESSAMMSWTQRL